MIAEDDFLSLGDDESGTSVGSLPDTDFPFNEDPIVEEPIIKDVRGKDDFAGWTLFHHKQVVPESDESFFCVTDLTDWSDQYGYGSMMVPAAKPRQEQQAPAPPRPFLSGKSMVFYASSMQWCVDMILRPNRV
jgi:hypothetical protein